MKVRSRLLLGFGGVFLLLLAPTLFAASRLAQLRHLAVEGRSGQAAAVADLGRLQALVSDLDRLERSFVATSDSVLGEAARLTVDSLTATYGRLRRSPYGTEAEALGPVVEGLDSLAARVSSHVGAGRVEEATETLGSMMTHFGRMDEAIADVAGAIDAVAREDFSRAERLSESARSRTLLFLVLSGLLGVSVVFWTTQALTEPLHRLRRAMARVADGSFETPEHLPYERDDEIGGLSRSFRTMTHRLEELDRTKAEFVGMASHELKTPLNVIAAYAELIEEGLDDESSERHRTMINAVAEQAEIMAKRVSRLMDISRIDAGTYRLAPEPVRIEDLVTGLLRLFEQVADGQGVELHVEVDESCPDSVVVDVDVVRDEILGNLVANALRFTPAGGCITVEATGVEGGIHFTVTDSGPGIPEEHRPFIFEKHYTSDRTQAVGSGLGLAIAKEMVELHGGSIRLEQSPDGKGARFRVALPSHAADADLEIPVVPGTREVERPVEPV